MHACQHLGINSFVSSNPMEIEQADALILPGVGAFNEAMINIKQLGLGKSIIASINNGTPIMGVCLGLQLLFERSYEFYDTEGLGVIKGEIKKFPKNYKSKEKIKVPQVGWNKLSDINKNNFKDSPLRMLTKEDYLYFVHSYYVVPKHKNAILSMTNYEGLEYCSSVFLKQENVFAVQFHPEKSGPKGIEIYKQWAIINRLL
jgi:glutamine amidotransferase